MLTRAFGRHIVGRHRHGLLELDGRARPLVKVSVRVTLAFLGVGRHDGQGVAAVHDLRQPRSEPIVSVLVSAEGPVGAQRHAVQLLHDRDLMAVGVGDGVLIGGRRGGEAAEVGVAAADDGGRLLVTVRTALVV